MSATGQSLRKRKATWCWLRTKSGVRICAAAGRLTARGVELTRDRLCVEVAGICLGIVERELDGVIAPRTAGERMFKLYRFAGARG